MKIVVVGLGSIARKQVDAIKKIDGGAVVFALRHDKGSISEEGIINIFSLADIENIKPDFAIISNPTFKHAKTIELLSSLHIPLFVEKPVSSSLCGIDDVLKKCRNILTYVACNLRFLDSIVWLKRALNGKVINEVNVYCGSYLPEWRDVQHWRDIYSANRAMGGGVHMDMIHEIDYVFYLFGNPSKVHNVFRSCSSLCIDACDYANYCLEYPKFAVSIVLDYYRRDYKRTIEIVMEDKTWLCDLYKNIITEGDSIIYESNQRFADTYLEQMKYFISLVKNNNKVSFNSVDEAYDVLKICLN